MKGSHNEKHEHALPPPIAIIGASYAGLTLANVLHQRSIPYVIFDSKSLPFTHVTGGATFNVPSYELIAKKLELDVANHSGGEYWPSRKEVVESLLQRVKSNMITSQRIVSMENRSGLFYLHSLQTHHGRGTKEQSGSIHGPFASVIGADGVRSKVRTSALSDTFLIGDARWVNDRWYDLGLCRIDRGADMALLDGMELGQALNIAKDDVGTRDNQTMIVEAQMRRKYCASEIAQRRFQRLFAISMVILAIIMFKFQNECYSLGYNTMDKVKDTIFSDDCLSHDENGPFLSFQFHNKLQELGLEGTYAMLIPNRFFWMQIGVLIIIQSIVAIIVAMIIYVGVIKRRGSILSYLLCWGFILPFALSFPFYLIRFFDVRNTAVVAATGVAPTFFTFRCLEALYGFSPHSVEDSVWNYCLYYSSVIEFVFDEKTRLPAKATRKDLLQKGKFFGAQFLVVIFLLSVMEHCNYQPFGTKREEVPGGMMSSQYLQPGHIGNNFLSAVLTSSILASGTGVIGFVISGLAGILTLDVMDSPMFKSTSVSDFWGRRWNRMVHGVLKRGVYKPVRKHTSSRTIAALSAFFMSGILHEYVLLLFSMPSSANAQSSESYGSYEPSHGNQFCFFLWNGMLMALEYSFINWTITSQQKISAPPIVKSIMIILMALPVSHWFTDEYIGCGFFSHYAVGFPIIAQLR